MSHLDFHFRAVRQLFLTGVFLSLCHCGGGSSSKNTRDAKDAISLDAGSPDLTLFDARITIDTSVEISVDSAFEVPPASQADARIEEIADAHDTRMSDGKAVDIDAAHSPDGGVSPDLSQPDASVVSDLGSPMTDAPLDGSHDQSADARATFDAGADTTAVGIDLGGTNTGGQCNTLDDSVAPLHDEIYVDGPVPLPTGGVIADGLYYEKSAEIYSTTKPAGPTGSKRRMVMRIAGSAIEAAYFSSSSGEHRFESDTMGPGSADAGTGFISLAQVCVRPPPGKLLAMDLGYSVVGSGAGATLTFIYPPITFPGLGSQTIVLTLVRQ